MNRTMRRFSPQVVRAALRHLRANDPILRNVIQQVGPCQLKLQPGRFHSLVRSIISQQISGHAARSIRQRLEDLVAPMKVSAQTMNSLTVQRLRSVGLSQQKATYIKDLARKVANDELQLNQIGRLSDEKVIEQLTQVNGIGRWTAQMFLMFCLGRPNVLPYDDLGIRSALRKMYDLDDLPNKAICQEIAQPWRPYATIACWYCWRSLDLTKESS